MSSSPTITNPGESTRLVDESIRLIQEHNETLALMYRSDNGYSSHLSYAALLLITGGILVGAASVPLYFAYTGQLAAFGGALSSGFFELQVSLSLASGLSMLGVGAEQSIFGTTSGLSEVPVFGVTSGVVSMTLGVYGEMLDRDRGYELGIFYGNLIDIGSGFYATARSAAEVSKIGRLTPDAISDFVQSTKDVALREHYPVQHSPNAKSNPQVILRPDDLLREVAPMPGQGPSTLSAPHDQNSLERSIFAVPYHSIFGNLNTVTAPQPMQPSDSPVSKPNATPIAPAAGSPASQVTPQPAQAPKMSSPTPSPLPPPSTIPPPSNLQPTPLQPAAKGANGSVSGPDLGASGTPIDHTGESSALNPGVDINPNPELSSQATAQGPNAIGPNLPDYLGGTARSLPESSLDAQPQENGLNSEEARVIYYY